MTIREVASFRISNQYIAGSRTEKPGDIVRRMGAIQAQDYAAALWGVGLRTRDATEETIEQAIAQKKIIRTWPMRGTLHFVAPGDVRWMLKYFTPRIVARSALRSRQLHLDAGTFSRSGRLIAKALEGNNRLTRDNVYSLLEKNRISCAGQRGIHILWQLAHEGLLCFGPRSGKQPTFVLLDEWVPPAEIPSRDEALAELARRYFSSHGPATLRDFAWWSGLRVSDATAGLEAVRHKLISAEIEGTTFWMSQDASAFTQRETKAILLPAFDEFLVAYKDRSFAVHPRNIKRIHPGGGILNSTVILDGKVVGTWKRSRKKDGVAMTVLSFGRLTLAQRRSIEKAARSYGTFLGEKERLQFAH